MSSLKDKKIAVIGGEGFIGKHTRDKLKNRGAWVYSFDRKFPQTHPHYYLGPDDPANLREFIGSGLCDGIISLPSEMGFHVDYHRYFTNGAPVVAQIFELLERFQCRVPVIIASSQAAYGEMLGDDRWERSSHNLIPTSAYGLSKCHQEEIALFLGQAQNIPTYCMRYSIVVGAGQDFSSPYMGCIRNFIQATYHHKPPVIFEDGKQERDFVGVHDVAIANAMVMEKALEDKCIRPQHLFNVGGPSALKIDEAWAVVEEVVREVFGYLDRPLLVPSYPGLTRVGDVRVAVSSCDAIKHYTGRAPEWSFYNMVKDYVEWLKEGSVPIPYPPSQIEPLENDPAIVSWP